jgi:DnaJ like chaperone protein
LAQQDTAGFEAYASQIAKMLAGNPALLEDILDGLFEIAKADGVFHPGESAFLERVAEIFGFAPNEYRRIRAAHIGPDKGDPYVVLGVAHGADEAEVRATYRMLVRENHPDKLIARGVPEEFIRLATDKLAAINTAFDKIAREREWRR